MIDCLLITYIYTHSSKRRLLRSPSGAKSPQEPKQRKGKGKQQRRWRRWLFPAPAARRQLRAAAKCSLVPLAAPPPPRSSPSSI